MTVSIWRATTLANTTTSGAQDRAQIASLADGGFVMTWRDAANSGDIKARLFNADGSPRTGEIAVPASNSAIQTDPTVAALAGGGFLVAWSEGTATAARAFDAQGVAVGQQSSVADAARASATSFGGGAIVGYDSIFSDIGYERYDASGQKLGGTTTANNTDFNEQDDAALTELSGGRFLLTWQTDGIEVRARILTAAGPAAAASDFKVNTTSELYGPGTPRTATLAGGGFVITWLAETSGGDVNVRARVFGADGAPAGADFVVNSITAGNQFNGEVVELEDGGFIVLWYDQTLRTVEAQRFTSVGQKVDGQFSVTADIASANELRNVSATLLDDGRVAVAFRGISLASGDGDLGVYTVILDPRDGVVVGDGRAETLFGGQGADLVVGYGGDDRLVGLGGDDQMYGGDNNDVLEGGAGNDFLRGQVGNDAIYGGAGLNTLWGEEGQDLLVGGDAADVMLGGDAADQIYGGAGGDQIDGGAGNDFVRGLEGADVIYGGSGLNALWGDAGDDLILGGEDADTILGGDGADQVYAGGGQDLIEGGLGSDFIRGLGDADSIHGGEGADRIYGDGGADLLWGDGGADVFVYLSVSDSAVTAPDQLIDFVSGSDKLDFSAITAGQAVSWALLAAGGGYQALDIDVGANGSVDLRVVLSPGATVTAGDLIFG